MDSDERITSVCRGLPRASPQGHFHADRCFARTFKPDKFNYLMLMMVDPNVHFHVLPRYSSSRKCAGVAFEDRAWPKAPSLGEVTPTTLAQRNVIFGLLHDAWPI